MGYNEIKFIVGLSFGKGKVNEYLADVVLELHKQCPESWIILQKEIAENYDFDIYEIICRHRQEGKYLDTWEVLSQVKEIVGDKKVCLVAHPDHLPRARLIAKILGLNIVEGRVPYREIPYDSKDPQIHCRNRFFFLIWEFFSYLFLLFKKCQFGLQKK